MAAAVRVPGFELLPRCASRVTWCTVKIRGRKRDHGRPLVAAQTRAPSALSQTGSGVVSHRCMKRAAIVVVLAAVLAHAAGAQRASRPADDWMAGLEAPERVTGLRIPE